MLSVVMGLCFGVFRYLGYLLFLRYLPRLLDRALRDRIPHSAIRRPLVWWLVRRLLSAM